MAEQTTPGATDSADLFEIIRTTRSMRRLRPDPVPNELIRKILEAGVCAPSGGNMQRWHFLLVHDQKVKESIGALYKRAWDEQVGPRYPRPDRGLISRPTCDQVAHYRRAVDDSLAGLISDADAETFLARLLAGTP